MIRDCGMALSTLTESCDGLVTRVTMAAAGRGSRLSTLYTTLPRRGASASASMPNPACPAPATEADIYASTEGSTARAPEGARCRRGTLFTFVRDLLTERDTL